MKERTQKDTKSRQRSDMAAFSSIAIGHGYSTPREIWIVWKIRKAHGLGSRRERLRQRGWLTLDEMAATLSVHPQTVKDRASRSQLASVVYNDKHQRLYAPPEPVPMIACLHCGKSIPERVQKGQRQKYCCVSCRTGAYAARRRAAGWVRMRQRP